MPPQTEHGNSVESPDDNSTRYLRALVGVADGTGAVTYIVAGLRDYTDDAELAEVLMTWARTERQALALVNLGNVAMLTPDEIRNARLPRETPTGRIAWDWQESGRPTESTNRDELIAGAATAERVDAVVLLERGAWVLWRVFPPGAKDALDSTVKKLTVVHEEMDATAQAFEEARRASGQGLAEVAGEANATSQRCASALAEIAATLRAGAGWERELRDRLEPDRITPAMNSAVDDADDAEWRKHAWAAAAHRVDELIALARGVLRVVDERGGVEARGLWPLGSTPGSDR